MGKQSSVCVGSAPTRLATFCVKAEPVGQLWAGSASFLLLAERTKNLSSGFGQNCVLLPVQVHALLTSVSLRWGALGSRGRGGRCREGPCEYPGTPGLAAPTTRRGERRGTGVPGGCLPGRQEPQPLLAEQEAGVSRLAERHSHLPQGTPVQGLSLNGFPGQRVGVQKGRAGPDSTAPGSCHPGKLQGHREWAGGQALHPGPAPLPRPSQGKGVRPRE